MAAKKVHISRFTPSIMDQEMLEAIFVQRQDDDTFLVEPSVGVSQDPRADLDHDGSRGRGHLLTKKIRHTSPTGRAYRTVTSTLGTAIDRGKQVV